MKDEFWSDCEACGGTGWLGPDESLSPGHPQFGKLQMCSCLERWNIERGQLQLQETSQLTSLERQISLDDVDVGSDSSKQLIQAAEAFIADPVGIVTVWGGSGNAKTMVVLGVVNALLESGVPVLYTTMFDLMSNIRAAFDRNDLTAVDLLARYQKVRVLAIDEFDKIKRTDWVEEQVSALIDRRYRTGVAGESGTFIAMNADPDTLDSWIASRLRASGNRVIENTDFDRRQIDLSYTDI